MTLNLEEITLVRVVIDGRSTTLKYFFAVGFKNFNIINLPSFVRIDTKGWTHGMKIDLLQHGTQHAMAFAILSITIPRRTSSVFREALGRRALPISAMAGK